MACLQFNSNSNNRKSSFNSSVNLKLKLTEKINNLLSNTNNTGTSCGIWGTNHITCYITKP
jgi:hypothetical protein